MEDILLNVENELQFQNGDLLIGYSDDMHIQHHIQANKGAYYQHPFTGVGIERYRNAPVQKAQVSNDIRADLVDDNFNVREIIVGGNIDELLIEVNAQMK
jgi:hypothetical protein